MRVASNKLKDILDFYYSELLGTYDRDEIEAIISIAVHHYLGFSKTEIIKKANDNINQSDLLKLYDCCKELKKNIPLQYILAEAWFYHLKFKVNNHVLIPRPETEELVDLILKEDTKPVSLLDIGCGSGCIPVALKKNLQNTTVSACDISKEALVVAKENARLNDTDIHFFEADVLNTRFFVKKTEQAFDCIVSNPPYIKKKEAQSMTKQVLDHEPHLALFVEEEDEIIFYKKIIDLCKMELSSGGKLYFELNPLTAHDVLAYANESGLFATCALIMDMSGKQRFFRGIRK